MKSLFIFFFFFILIEKNTAQFSIQGDLLTYNGEKVQSVTVFLIQNSDTIATAQSDADGHYVFSNIQAGQNYLIQPYKKSSFLYVNANDYNRIQKQILISGELLSYEFIAADLNNSQNINTFDLLNLQALLLGVIDENSIPSWKFIPETFLMPQNPNGLSYPTSISISNLNQNLNDQNFVGIKMGDLTPNDEEIIDENDPQMFLIQKPPTESYPYIEIEWWGYNFENVESFQLQINWDSLLLDSINFYNGNLSNFDVSENKVKKKEPKGHSTFVWFKMANENPDTVLIAGLMFDEKCIQNPAATKIKLPDTIFLGKSAALYKSLKKINNASLGELDLYVDENVVAITEVMPSLGSTATLIIHLSELSTGTSPFTFYWSNGEITTDTSIIVTPGVYFCTVIDAKGCETVFGPMIFTGSNTSDPSPLSFSVAPNPSSGWFVINVEANSNDVFKAVLFNQLGEIVLEQNIMATNTVINFNESSPPGVYRLVLLSSNSMGWTQVVLINRD